MREASEEERARFRSWVNAGRVTFGITLTLEGGVVGGMLWPHLGRGFAIGLIAGGLVAYWLDERFRLWIR
jgi:hypothetical protein